MYFICFAIIYYINISLIKIATCNLDDILIVRLLIDYQMQALRTLYPNEGVKNFQKGTTSSCLKQFHSEQGPRHNTR